MPGDGPSVPGDGPLMPGDGPLMPGDGPLISGDVELDINELLCLRRFVTWLVYNLFFESNIN